jgi:hypothetical protein
MLLTGNSSFFRLQDGSLMEITKVYPLDAVYDTPEDVPEDVRKMFLYFIKRYKNYAQNISSYIFYENCIGES